MPRFYVLKILRRCGWFDWEECEQLDHKEGESLAVGERLG